MQKIMMMKSKMIIFIALISFLFSCRVQNKNDLIGVYVASDAQALDSAIKSISGWRLELMDKNNFEIRGPEKKLLGYWRALKTEDGQTDLLFQANGITEHALVKDGYINIEHPSALFDSVFRRVSFAKIKNPNR